MRKIKLLTVLESAAGGAGRHVADLLLNIDLNLFDVWLVYSSRRADGRFLYDLEGIRRRGIVTVEVGMVRKVAPVDDLKAFMVLWRLIKREKFDIVHGHSSKAGFLGRMAAKLAYPKAKTVFTPHGISAKANHWFLWLEKLAGAFTDTIIAVSESERRELINYRLVSPGQITVVNNGVNLPCETGVDPVIRQQFGVPQDAILIGTCGRVAMPKDPDTFIQAGLITLRRHSNCFFLWIGSGEMLTWARSEVRRLGVADRMLFVGYRTDVEMALRSCDIFLFTSLAESFGYATAEAMALSLPVVATHTTGTTDLVVPKLTGILAPVGDPVAISDALEELINSPPMRLFMGTNGRARIGADFSVSAMVRDTEVQYQRLLRPEMVPVVSSAVSQRSL
jgi:glycosyltransferase involved in cell wall biosynthesis